MKRRLFGLVVLGSLLLVSITAFAQGGDSNSVAKASTLKFTALPVLPSCATVSPTHGDPFKGAAVIAAKAATNCKIPWHWHSVAEQLIVVSGKGKVEMHDGNMSETVGSGDFVNLAEKHVHQFTCLQTCSFYIVTNGAFDIHYVDKDGKEIKVEDALKAAGNQESAKPAKPAAKKPGAPTGM